MMPDLSVFTIVRAELELRVRNAARVRQAAHAVASDQRRTARPSLRLRFGTALVACGEWVGGTAASPTIDELGQIER